MVLKSLDMLCNMPLDYGTIDSQIRRGSSSSGGGSSSSSNMVNTNEKVEQTSLFV